MAQDATDPVEIEDSSTDVDLENDDTSFEDGEDESDEEVEPDGEATETEEEDEPDAEEESEPEESPAEDPKQEQDDVKARNREMAQKRLAEKAERELTLGKQQQEYIADAETESEQILRQLQVDAYNNKVEANTDRLSNAYAHAVKDFDILSNSDPVIQAELADAIDAFQARYVQMDDNGNPTKVTGDFYAYLQDKADSIQRLTGIASRTQAQSKDKEKSKVLPRPSRAPKQPKVDPDLAGFDEEAAKGW